MNIIWFSSILFEIEERERTVETKLKVNFLPQHFYILSINESLSSFSIEYFPEKDWLIAYVLIFIDIVL